MVVKYGDLPWDRIRRKSPTEQKKSIGVDEFIPYEIRSKNGSFRGENTYEVGGQEICDFLSCNNFNRGLP